MFIYAKSVRTQVAMKLCVHEFTQMIEYRIQTHVFERNSDWKMTNLKTRQKHNSKHIEHSEIYNFIENPDKPSDSSTHKSQRYSRSEKKRKL